MYSLKQIGIIAASFLLVGCNKGTDNGDINELILETKSETEYDKSVDTRYLCVNYDQQMICPVSDSNVVPVLQPIAEKDAHNDEQTRVLFEPHITIGEKSRFEIASGFDGYLGLISVQRDGSRRSVYPNAAYPDGFVKKEENLILPDFQKNLRLQGNKGLGYLLVVVTEKLAYFSMSQKGKSVNGFKDDDVFIQILQEIKSGKYGKHYLTLLPYYSYTTGGKSLTTKVMKKTTVVKKTNTIKGHIKLISDHNVTQESVVVEESNETKEINTTKDSNETE